MNCDLALTPLTEANQGVPVEVSLTLDYQYGGTLRKTVSQPYPSIPACPGGKTCITSTTDQFKWIRTASRKFTTDSIEPGISGVASEQACITHCDNEPKCKVAMYQAGSKYCRLKDKELHMVPSLISDGGYALFEKAGE